MHEQRVGKRICQEENRLHIIEKLFKKEQLECWKLITAAAAAAAEAAEAVAADRKRCVEKMPFARQLNIADPPFACVIS